MIRPEHVLFSQGVAPCAAAIKTEFDRLGVWMVTPR